MSNPTHVYEPADRAAAEDQRRAEAREYVQRLRAWYLHAAVCAASLVIILAVNVLVNVAAGIAGEWWAWWSIWALIGCALALAVHGLVVWLSRPDSAGSAWEERQIERILS